MLRGRPKKTVASVFHANHSDEPFSSGTIAPIVAVVIYSINAGNIVEVDLEESFQVRVMRYHDNSEILLQANWFFPT